jgi:hypothetical protein
MHPTLVIYSVIQTFTFVCLTSLNGKTKVVACCSTAPFPWTFFFISITDICCGGGARWVLEMGTHMLETKACSHN